VAAVTTAEGTLGLLYAPYLDRYGYAVPAIGTLSALLAIFRLVSRVPSGATYHPERAKGHVKGSLVLSLEDPSGRMSRLGKSEIAHGEILTVDQTLRRIESVSLQEARRVAERVLSQPMTLTVLGPFGAGEFKEA